VVKGKSSGGAVILCVYRTCQTGGKLSSYISVSSILDDAA